MKSEKRTVSLGRIRPNKNNPRKEFGDIEALAEAIKATGGMPVNPIVVVDDDGDYVIVDGERRYRALKTMYEDGKDVDVLVVDDYSSAAELVAMLATDDKLGLTDAEKAHGFQLGLVLGVEDEPLAQALHSDADKVQAARKVWRKLGDEDREKYAQVSLDQFAAASEFEGEDREAVLACNPTWYKGKVDEIRERRTLEACVDAMMDRCAMLGIEWRPKLGKDEGADFAKVGAVWIGSQDTPTAAADRLESELDGTGATLVCRSNGYSSKWCVLAYAPAGDGPSPNELRRRQERALNERVSAARASLKKRVIEWVCAERLFTALNSLIVANRDDGFRPIKDLKDLGIDDETVFVVRNSVSAFEVCEYLVYLGTHYWDDPWAAEVIEVLEPYGFEATDEDKWLIEHEAEEGDDE